MIHTTAISESLNVPAGMREAQPEFTQAGSDNVGVADIPDTETVLETHFHSYLDTERNMEVSNKMQAEKAINAGNTIAKQEISGIGSKDE